MSTLYNDEWEIGETWTWIVDCTDSQGNALEPDSIAFRLFREGTVHLLMDEANPNVEIAGNRVTITVPTAYQTMPPGVYERTLFITTSAGAISKQLHGDLTLTKRRGEDPT